MQTLSIMKTETDHLTPAPAEIQLMILRTMRHTDALALSRTNTYFRKVVGPRRMNYVYSLLEQEAEGECGGEATACKPFNALNTPPNKSRWACIPCMRLLPHERFDKASITDAEFRKPISDSAVAKVPRWGEDEEYSMRKDPRECPVLGEQFKLYHKLLRFKTGQTSPGDRSARDYLLKLAQPELTALADPPIPWSKERRTRIGTWVTHKIDMLEKRLAGCSRIFRACIECRFECGDFANNEGDEGTPDAPVIRSRSHPFASSLERFFPGLLEPEACRMPDSASGGSTLAQVCEAPRALQLIRCPTCEVWQEQRAFRIGSHYAARPRPFFKVYNGESFSVTGRILVGAPRAPPPVGQAFALLEGFQSHIVHRGVLQPAYAVLQKVTCNQCFADEYGERELGQQLRKWAHDLILQLTDKHKAEMYRKWDGVLRHMCLDKEVHAAIQPICQPFYSHSKPLCSGIIKTNDLGFLNMPVEIVRDFFRDIHKVMNALCASNCDPVNLNTHVWVQNYFLWVPEHKKALDRLEWLETLPQRLDDRAAAIVQWALSRRGTCLA